jgi:vacuolar-type H+-ATPase subunit C/Vma6
MLLRLSVLLFSLVAFELFSTIKKATEEGHLAFLSPRIQSSSERVLSERIEELLKRKDVKNLKALLLDAGVIEDFEQTLESLQSYELKLAKDFEEHYNRILHYFPDDLKDFFESYTILWDVENLKLVMCYTLNQKQPDRATCPAGPFGFLDPRWVESLTSSDSPEQLLKDANPFLPPEFASKLSIEGGLPFHAYAFALDSAAFQYLKEKSSKIQTRRVRFAWDVLTGSYELRNLVTMARLKFFETPTEQLEKFLFPSWKHLEQSSVEQLLQAENYPAFLLALRGTPYGKHLPKGQIDPDELEGFLKAQLRSFEFAEMRRDITVEMAVRFLLDLGEQFAIIRESAFFVSIRSLDGGTRK